MRLNYIFVALSRFPLITCPTQITFAEKQPHVMSPHFTVGIFSTVVMCRILAITVVQPIGDCSLCDCHSCCFQVILQIKYNPIHAYTLPKYLPVATQMCLQSSNFYI